MVDWYFVQQPNGLLARYNVPGGNFPERHLTSEEAVQLAVNKYRVPEKQAREDVQTAMNAGARLWNYTIETVLETRGYEVAREYRRELSKVYPPTTENEVLRIAHFVKEEKGVKWYTEDDHYNIHFIVCDGSVYQRIGFPARVLYEKLVSLSEEERKAYIMLNQPPPSSLFR